MPDNNLRQAMVPEGATIIPQTRGTAPGLMCPVGDKVIYAVPGVPHEMYDMMERAILPDLRRRNGDVGVIVSRVIRTWGESESGLNERLDRVIAELEEIGNPTLAFLASGWEGLKVRLTAKGETETEARAVLESWEKRVLEEVGDFVFGYDGDNMEAVVIRRMTELGLTLAVAESVTGGLVSGRLTSIPGASHVLHGSVVSYASAVKHDVLRVPPGPVVSEAAAVAMADGVRRLLGTDIGLSLTGVAGPTEQDGQPIGTLWVGLSRGGAETTAAHFRLPGQRDPMRQMAVISALDLLRRSLDRTS
jgi:nicotinamide-nucleotide amidase